MIRVLLRDENGNYQIRNLDVVNSVSKMGLQFMKILEDSLDMELGVNLIELEKHNVKIYKANDNKVIGESRLVFFVPIEGHIGEGILHIPGPLFPEVIEYVKEAMKSIEDEVISVNQVFG